MKVLRKIDRHDPKFAAVAEELGVPWEDVETEFYEYIPADITCDFYRAKLTGFEVTYFDGSSTFELELK